MNRVVNYVLKKVMTEAFVFVSIATVLCVMTFLEASVVAASAVKSVTERQATVASESESPNTVKIFKYGIAREFSTSKGTVAETLARLNMAYVKNAVYPAPETKVKDGMIIHVLGRNSQLVTEESPVAFETEYIDDPAMDYGETRVEQGGVMGKDEVTYENILRTGMEEKIELARKRLVEPQKEVVRRGIAKTVWTDKGYVPYKKKMVVEASAYTLAEGSGHGLTSIGLVPAEGIVAVDPRVIPYHTRMYIPGYGFAIAGDTGGAIRGNRIDLFMHSYYKAIHWGRQELEIYILS